MWTSLRHGGRRHLGSGICPGPGGRAGRRELHHRPRRLPRPGGLVGANCKIQNYALVYEPARLGDGVFVGPAVVFTNDEFPRAVTVDGTLKTDADWQAVGVEVRDGAAIGARSVCVAPVVIGRWALVGAGATVVKDVPDFALVVGSPPARVGWVGRAGHPLRSKGDGLYCALGRGAEYVETDGILSERPAS